MQQRTMRFAGLLILLIGIIATSTPATAGLPPGMYAKGCYRGVYGIYNMLGKMVMALPGPCPQYNYLTRIFVQELVSPPPPTLTPMFHPAWEGKTAWQWISFINTGVLIPPEAAITIDLNELGSLENAPQLNCSTADFNQGPPQ